MVLATPCPATPGPHCLAPMLPLHHPQLAHFVFPEHSLHLRPPRLLSCFPLPKMPYPLFLCSASLIKVCSFSHFLLSSTEFFSLTVKYVYNCLAYQGWRLGFKQLLILQQSVPFIKLFLCEFTSLLPLDWKVLKAVPHSCAPKPSQDKALPTVPTIEGKTDPEISP